jgi:rhodanese-related sulfurtransferase
VVEDEREAERAELELVRIGFDQIAGFISADDLDETLQITQIGYRSSIAASLLESEGFDRLANVMGGMYGVRHAKRPRLPIMELADSAITWEIERVKAWSSPLRP